MTTELKVVVKVMTRKAEMKVSEGDGNKGRVAAMGHGEMLVVAVVGRDAADGGGGHTPGRQVVVAVGERASTRV